MLILELRKGEGVVLIDQEKAAELGTIKRLRPADSESPNKYLLGFDFPKTIQIIRESLIKDRKE